MGGKRKAFISRKSFSYSMCTFFNILSCKFVQKKSKCCRWGEISLHAIKLPYEINDLLFLEIRRWKTGLVENCTLYNKCTTLYMKFPLKTLLDCWIKWNFLAFSMILLGNMLFALWSFSRICKGNTLRLVNECVSGIFFVIHYSNCYLGKYRCFKKNIGRRCWKLNQGVGDLNKYSECMHAFRKTWSATTTCMQEEWLVKHL